MLKVKVTGRVRHKTKSKFGPFKRESWEEENFQLLMSAGDEIKPAGGIFLRCTGDATFLEVEGTVKGTQCYFGKVDPSNSKPRANFVMASVRHIEFTGTLEAVE